MTRPLLTLPLGYSPPVVDKVERLLELLSALREDPELGSAFVLHGGTALNLFHDRAPRLSVDIDLMFVGATEVMAMKAMRPQIDTRLREVMRALGYVVQGTNQQHSGQTYRIKYPGDYVKVDVSYLARVALLEPELLVCQLADPPVDYPVLRLEELVAGKLKAIMERVAVRDVYDLYRLAGRLPNLFETPLARALAIRAICTSDPFPGMTDPAVALGRFRDPTPDLVGPLFAMLRQEDIPDYSEMLNQVFLWLSPLRTLRARETEFMRLLNEDSDHRSELLFAEWPEVLERARLDPVMAWKVKNLRARRA